VEVERCHSEPAGRSRGGTCRV